MCKGCWRLKGATIVHIPVAQPVAKTGKQIQSIGPVQESAWDKFGRRKITLMTARGNVDVVQGITEITPHWTKVEGLMGVQSYVWDERIATSSIPRDTLVQIVTGRGDPTNPDRRLQAVRLFIQAERYQDAQAELKRLIKDFPDLEGPREVQPEVSELGAKMLLTEAKVRRKAGQHQLVMAMLKEFPAENVSGTVLVQVRKELEEYQAMQANGQQLLKEFDTLLADLDDTSFKAQVTAIRAEMGNEISFNTIDRLASFKNLLKDPALTPDQKLALAISGWLVGADDATEQPKVALGLIEVRAQVREFLADPIKLSRDRTLEKLIGLPYGSPKLVVRMIANMNPPIATPAQTEPGFFELTVPSIDGAAPVNYYIQLPPEYDPHRSYPTVVTLNAAWTTPLQQIDWWSGVKNAAGARLGQGTRHGYIVIAPEWTASHQKRYEYLAREHAAVLGSLRDACRRFSIDTDRVFLSGHSMGGDAAWDIALAHPDLWAGVIPIVAVGDKFVTHYSQNGRLLPMYFIGGELDGDKMVVNAMNLDRYLAPVSPGPQYDVTVVEYLGRGHENFSDEVQRVFDWMSRKHREFFPREFTANTLRPWDNFFWWVEMHGMPAKSQVDPANWPPASGTHAMKIDATVNKVDGITVNAPGAKVTVWLSPELIDFDRAKPVKITINRTLVSSKESVAKADLGVMLEDVRTRGDRKHPFWAKVEQ